jgi:hypothetical protein
MADGTGAPDERLVEHTQQMFDLARSGAGVSMFGRPDLFESTL